MDITKPRGVRKDVTKYTTPAERYEAVTKETGMHYIAEVIIPPTQDVHGSVAQVMNDIREALTRFQEGRA